jgi:hypothetical protein
VAEDRYKLAPTDMGSPATQAVAVTPDNTTDLATGVTRALYVGGAGNLVVTMANGVDATFTGVAAGTYLPVRVGRVKATGTTATAILALY